MFYLVIYFFGSYKIIYHYNELDEKHVFLSILFIFETNNLGAKRPGVPNNLVSKSWANKRCKPVSLFLIGIPCLSRVNEL